MYNSICIVLLKEKITGVALGINCLSFRPVRLKKKKIIQVQSFLYIAYILELSSLDEMKDN